MDEGQERREDQCMVEDCLAVAEWYPKLEVYERGQKPGKATPYEAEIYIMLCGPCKDACPTIPSVLGRGAWKSLDEMLASLGRERKASRRYTSMRYVRLSDRFDRGLH